MKANAIFQAFAQVLKSPIYFVCAADHNGVEYYIALSKHSLFIVDAQLNEVKAEVFYAHLSRVVLDPNKGSYIQLQLSDNREEHLPSKMNLAIEDRKQFSDWLRVNWKTDYMFRLGKVCDLPTFQGNIENISGQPLFLKASKPPVSLLIPNAGWLKYEVRGYVFHIPEKYEQTNKSDLTFYWQKDFALKSGEKVKRTISKICIQMSDEIPLDVIQGFQGREHIEYYCEEFASKLMHGYPGGKGWVMTSRTYNKRCNLNLDPACWQGWEIHLRTKKRDVIVMVLRRKFIPPLYNHFVDFFVYIESPEQRPQQLAKLPPDAKHYENTQITLALVRDVVDSFYSTFIPSQTYDLLIKERANCLLYDEETYEFLHFRSGKNIRPTAVIYAAMFLKSILKMLATKEAGLMALVHLLYGKIKDDLETFTDPELTWETDLKPQEIMTKLLSKCIITSKQDEGEQKKWDFKIAKYFSYCIDGGLLGDNCTLDLLVKWTKESNAKIAEELTEVIFRLLALNSEKGGMDEGNFQNKLFRMINTKETRERYVFNEAVMRVLIETGFIDDQLKTSEKQGFYNKFLIHILENAQSPNLKFSACCQIIHSQSEKKASASGEGNFMEIKNLSRPLLGLYNGDNIDLASAACVALTNLCAKAKDVKIYIMQEGGGKMALEHVEHCKAEDLLMHSLQFISTLITVSQNVAGFLEEGIVAKFLSILEGSGIVGVYYPDRILIIIFKMARTIIENMEETKKTFLSNLKIIYNIFAASRTHYTPSEALQLEVLNFCLKLCAGDSSAKRKFGEMFMDLMMERAKDGKFTISDLKQRSIAIFIMLLKDVEEMSLKVKDDDIFENRVADWAQDYAERGQFLMQLLEKANEEEKKEEEVKDDKKKPKKK
jgi:hypothetical protein